MPLLPESWFDRLTMIGRKRTFFRGGEVVVQIFLLSLVVWLLVGFGFGFGGSGCRRYGQRAWLRIELLGLRVLTAPALPFPGFRYARGASTTRQRRIFDLRRNDPVSSTGQAGGRGQPSRSGGETRRTGLCGAGDITSLCDSQRCRKIRRAVRHRRICDRVRWQRLAVLPEPL